MDEEASEDYSRLAGVSDIDSTDDSIFQTALKRLPWLLILTVLGMITASILGSLKKRLKKWLCSLLLYPLLAGCLGILERSH